MLECVLNLSEGRNAERIATLAAAAGDDLLDVHTDAHHHRSVFTVVGEQAPRRLAERAVELLDLREHSGVHPRIGVVDVVPFVALDPTPPSEARRAADDFAAWAASELALPCFRYGDELTLPELRRRAFADLAPDVGPSRPHPSAGACAVGDRGVLIAYNVWLAEGGLEEARRIARALRGPALRALGLEVGDRVQVSMNLVDPLNLGPAEAFDAVAAHAPVERAELVGLVPAAVLEGCPEQRWAELDLSPARTIEACVAAFGR